MVGPPGEFDGGSTRDRRVRHGLREARDYSAGTYGRVGRRYGSASPAAFSKCRFDLGLIGALFFGLGVTGGIVTIARGVWRSRTTPSLIWALVFTVVAVEHLTEYFVLWYSYVWVLVVAAVFVPLSDD